MLGDIFSPTGAKDSMRAIMIVLCNNWLDLTKFGRNYSYMVPFIIVQVVSVCCISRSHRLKIDFRDENFKNFLI